MQLQLPKRFERLNTSNNGTFEEWHGALTFFANFYARFKFPLIRGVIKPLRFGGLERCWTLVLDIERVAWKILSNTNTIIFLNSQARIFALEVMEAAKLLYFVN